jgi:hypothetical protein
MKVQYFRSLLMLILIGSLCWASYQIFNSHAAYQAAGFAKVGSESFRHDTTTITQLNLETFAVIQKNTRSYRNPTNDLYEGYGGSILKNQLESEFTRLEKSPQNDVLLSDLQQKINLQHDSFKNWIGDEFDFLRFEKKWIKPEALTTQTPCFDLALSRKKTNFYLFQTGALQEIYGRVAGNHSCWAGDGFDIAASFDQSCYAKGDTVNYDFTLTGFNIYGDSIQIQLNGVSQNVKDGVTQIHLDNLTAGKHKLMLTSKCWHYDTGIHSDTTYYTVVVRE